MSTEKHQFNAEVAKVLQLVIHSLYTNKDIFLRELISNSSDACDKLRFEAQQNKSISHDILEIKIATDEAAKTLVIEDNGIGMNREELIENLGTIAKSGTLDFITKNKDASLIGQFGVGFYSAFMIADKVSVESLRADESKAYSWESKGDGEFTISDSDKKTAGTKITLFLREGEEQYLDKHRLTHIIQTYSDHIIIPILLNGERINKGTALWMRNKSDVTEEQYKEFYKSISHQVDKPLITLHGKAEGKIEYNYLLFIPTIKPFDLFHPDRMRRIKLYVRRVFIAEDSIDIIPRYLRFLRGVIDSEDLPLNISRESLQANPLVEKIKKSVTNKVLAELKKLGEKQPEEYNKFWNNYGAVLKEGLCETLDSKDPILEVCRFHSTNSEALTSIDDYIARAKPEQEEIYYLAGDDLEALKTSPQIEGFIKQGIEVLLFTDTVDDFWVNIAHEYKGKKFKSVTHSNINLEDGERRTENEEDDIITFFKTTLGDKVKDVKYSSRLTESPVCLAIAEGDMDFRMERFMRDNKQIPHESLRILEINKNHGLIKNIKAGKEDSADIVNLLFNQALIMEGEKLPDPKTFAQLINKLLEKNLAA